MKVTGTVALLVLLTAGCAFVVSRFDPPLIPPHPPDTRMLQEGYFEAAEVEPPNKSDAGGYSTVGWSRIARVDVGDDDRVIG